MKHHFARNAAALVAIMSIALFEYLWQGTVVESPVILEEVPSAISVENLSPKPITRAVPEVSFRHPASVTSGVAKVISESPKMFAYAHATAVANGRIFIGMAGKDGNPFPTDEILIIDASNTANYSRIKLSTGGDIESMVYDRATDKVYFIVSNIKALKIFSIDPHTFSLHTVASTSGIDVGRKPAIATDGEFVYGITDTDPSTVFRVNIDSGEVMLDNVGHIARGHSAAVGIYTYSTELYFGGGMSNGFEKTDATTLRPLAILDLGPCSMSDDMPFVATGENYGYAYVGCETRPFGIRVKTDDMTHERFSLPGNSLGLFIIGNDLYNAAKDGQIDMYKGQDLDALTRYDLIDELKPFVSHGQKIEPNELLYIPEDRKLFFTAWWGVPGLFEISTSTEDRVSRTEDRASEQVLQ